MRYIGRGIIELVIFDPLNKPGLEKLWQVEEDGENHYRNNVGFENSAPGMRR